jgi:hypothetical protein
MKKIITFLEMIQKTRLPLKFKEKEKTPDLGRWKLEYCNTKVDNKIDLSNEDHCGPCGQYGLLKSGEKEILPFPSSEKK